MFFDYFQINLFWQVLIAAVLGGIIGLEREFQKREAGLRTFSLVCTGSCFFTAVSVYLGSMPDKGLSFLRVDLGTVIQAVAIGIGFLGSGLIIYNKMQIEGLTTAAALWTTAALGIVIGLEMYLLAVLGTILIIVILSGAKAIEKKIFPERFKR